jgi:hypothetical protein
MFIWKAVNVRPIFEEPWDFNEIDRLLAKEDLDLETIILLMTIFGRLIRAPDKEAALFAAEGINVLERGYARRAKVLRDRAIACGGGAIASGGEDSASGGRADGSGGRADGSGGGIAASGGSADASGGRASASDRKSSEDRPRWLAALAALYRDFGLASFARPVLRSFYLGEALSVIAEIREGPRRAGSEAADHLATGTGMASGNSDTESAASVAVAKIAAAKVAAAKDVVSKVAATKIVVAKDARAEVAPPPASPPDTDLESLEIGILLELGEIGKAEDCLARALAIRPGDPDLIRLAARACFENRDWRGVLRVLEESSRFDIAGPLAELRDFWTGGTCHG